MFTTILLLLVLPLVAILSMASAALTFYVITPLISNLGVLIGIAVIVLLLTSGGLAWIISGRLLPKFRPQFTIVYSGIVLALAVFLVIKIFPRPVVSYQDPELLPGMAYWNLPTGSKLAYIHVPAAGDAKSTPIVFLHGGPGFLVLPSDVAFYSQLAQDGYDIYLYDQVGSGPSNRLADVRDYTTQRDVADLEAVRQQIGADQIILIGQSWGNTLLADYMDAYPNHVAKAIFSSPGAIWDVGRFKVNYNGTADSVIETTTPPWLVPLTVVFIPRNPLIAEQMLSERGLESYFDSQPASFNENYCKGAEDLVPVLHVRGANQYVNRLIFASQKAYPDPRPALRQNQTPAIIMRGECEFLPMEVAYEYKQTLPNSTFLSIPKAGHALYGAQPELILNILRAFLSDQELPIKPYIP